MRIQTNFNKKSIDNDEELMHSIFEVYDFNKDKNEFIENCTLVYLFLYRKNIVNIVRRNQQKMKWTDDDVKFSLRFY